MFGNNELAQQSSAVIGGGISGLVAALNLLDNGYNGENITVFEASNRLGGKIESGALDGRVINLGAEFIDSDGNPRLVGLCKRLGVPLIPATDQKTEQFCLPDGTFVSGEEFHKMYKPLAEQIIADKNNLIANNQYTDRAKHLENISLSEYLQELASKVPNGVDPRIIETVAGVYGSEAGNNPEKVDALQFVNEASSELGSFLNSDCGYRVEGGTYRLIEALRNYLQGAGVKFETGAKLKQVSKEGEKLHLGFESKQANEVFDKVALALPTNALAEVEGLEALGMTTEEREFIKNVQYTHSSKFFVRVKDGVEVDNACLFSGEGWQCWSSEKGMMTFLVGGEKANEKQGMELVVDCLEKYAATHGKKASDIFELAPDKVVMGSPDTKKPCYASPAMQQVMKLGALFGTMERMAEHGLALIGTYFPRRTQDGVSVGFMESGLAAADRAIGLVSAPAKEKSVAIPQTQPQSPEASWTEKLASSFGAGQQGQAAAVGA